jgi:subtilisin-like proprotein convertase family protein
MNRFFKFSALALLSVLTFGCGTVDGPAEDFGPNPFLEGPQTGKEDTGYTNLRGREVHVTIEAEVKASSWRIFDAPADLAQFAVTYLRNRNNFYLEILAEDATAGDRVEWLVDGEWLTREQAEGVDRGKLGRFRMPEVNAVVLNSQVDTIEVGKVYEATVPLSPFSIMTDADDKCADYDSHIDLSQSVYWYLWNPNKSDCPQELLQTMTLTVTEVLPHNPESYPEYDELWADQTLTVAVFFGKLDDGDVADDYNWNTFNRFCDWLGEAGFSESEDAPMGKRFVKVKDALTTVVDAYGPDVFHSVADYSRFHNWQKGVTEHEVIMYNGHSVLGTGYAFERADYPDFYQIFQVASCLSYEYYVRPVLAGKGDWDSVDVISNVEPTYYSENLPLTSTILAKLIWGFENNGQASWQDIMEAVSRRLGHSRFGVSGARGNCYSPEGDRCNPEPEPDPEPGELVFENATFTSIPDDAPEGVYSEIVVPDQVSVRGLKVKVDIQHTYIGDLKVALEKNGVFATLHDRTGGSDDDIHTTYEVNDFNGQSAAGTWRLIVSDHANYDTGAILTWKIAIATGDVPGPDPDPDTYRYESTAGVDIPDDDPNGVTSTIPVPDDITIGALKVHVDVSHTYINDLVIVLSHDGTDYALWDRQGGGDDDIQKAFDVAVFNGSVASGDWTLKISDNAGLDTGSLNSWTLEITPAD